MHRRTMMITLAIFLTAPAFAQGAGGGGGGGGGSGGSSGAGNDPAGVFAVNQGVSAERFARRGPVIDPVRQGRVVTVDSCSGGDWGNPARNTIGGCRSNPWR